MRDSKSMRNCSSKKTCFFPFRIIFLQRSTAASSASSANNSPCPFLWFPEVPPQLLLLPRYSQYPVVKTQKRLITLVSPSFHKSHKSLLLNSTTHKTSITFVLLPSLSFTAFRLNSLVPLFRLYCILHIRGQPLLAPFTSSRK